jgi:mono/diheme cytochrome c family protein
MRVSIKGLKAVVAAAMTLSFLAIMVVFQSNQSVAATLAPDGAASYKSKCASCHAADGSGNTATGKSMKLRDLRSAEVQGQSDDALYNVIAKGKGKMPGYEKTLGANVCRELVAHVRRLGGR